MSLIFVCIFLAEWSTMGRFQKGSVQLREIWSFHGKLQGNH